MNFDLAKPCDNCPFSRDCPPGWLGRARAGEIIVGITNGDQSFPCHKTTEFDDEGESVRSGAEQHCAGATILLEKLNMPNQMMRIAERLGVYDRRKLDMEQPMFDTVKEFVSHHGKKRTRRAARVQGD